MFFDFFQQSTTQLPRRSPWPLYDLVALWARRPGCFSFFLKPQGQEVLESSRGFPWLDYTTGTHFLPVDKNNVVRLSPKESGFFTRPTAQMCEGQKGCTGKAQVAPIMGQ